MRSLFEIGAELEALEALATDREGEADLQETMDARLAAWFESLCEEQAEKLERLRLWLVRLEGEAAVARAEAEQFMRMAKAREGRVTWIKEQVKAYMERRGTAKLLTSTGRAFSVVKNGGKLPLLPAEIRLEDVPKEWVPLVTVTKVVVDRELVLERLERGEQIEFAALGERQTHLRVK